LPVDIVIRGKNVEVSETLRSAAQKQMAKLDRFANGFARAEVDFSELRNPRVADNQVCEVLVHVKGHLLKAHASAAEPFAALSCALDKVQHQVKRLKEKRVTRTHPRRSRVESPAGTGEERDEAEPARIVKMKQFTIKPMSAEEAALQMDLLGHDFFFFTSSESGRAAVIYRRDDGDLGLIEATG
jgi:putative sigma-54 modulation protein